MLIAVHCAQAAQYATFESFYSSGGIGVWGWVGIGAATLAIAVITFVTFGGGAAAAPGWMAAVGTWIGTAAGYSGVAATNFGLALLGGGSVAAGGLGVAGGVAVLSAAASFGTEVICSYSVEVALEKWQMDNFVKASKEMMTLPIPRNEKGGKAYVGIVKDLNKRINNEVSLFDPANQAILEEAKKNLERTMDGEKDSDYRTKNKTLMALLHLQTGDYENALMWGNRAYNEAVNSKNKPTLPRFIVALSKFSLPDATDTNECTLQILEPAYSNEPDNSMIPIMTACCADRLGYKFHYGKITADELALFWEVVTRHNLKDSLAAQSLNILISRALVELKRNQQDILIVCEDEAHMAENEDVKRELLRRVDMMEALIGNMSSHLLPKLRKLKRKMPKDSKLTTKELEKLLTEYWQSLPELRQRIDPATYGTTYGKNESNSLHWAWWLLLAPLALLMCFSIKEFC